MRMKRAFEVKYKKKISQFDKGSCLDLKNKPAKMKQTQPLNVAFMKCFGKWLLRKVRTILWKISVSESLFNKVPVCWPACLFKKRLWPGVEIRESFLTGHKFTNLLKSVW